MHPSFTIKITGPRTFHIIISVLSTAGCLIGLLKYDASGFNEVKDLVTMTILIVSAGWFTHRVLFPKTKIIFTENGIWTNVHGQKSWDDYAGVAIEKRKKGRVNSDFLLLLFDIEEEPQEISYDFFDLSISVKGFKKLLNGPLKGYMEL